MNFCEFEKYFGEYIRGELSNSSSIEFQEHLITCKTCVLKLEDYYKVHRILDNYKRPKANIKTLNEYYDNLKNKFLFECKQDNVFNKVIKEIYYTFWSLSIRIKVAGIAFVLIVGITAGWLLFYPSQKLKIIERMESLQFSKPISKTDLERMNYFLLASEMILLEMENSEKDEIVNANDFYLNKEAAQKLLMKTFLIHEIALQLKNPQLLKFLSKMEILLYEISNLNNEEIVESLDSIKLTIREANLMDEVKNLQSIVANSRTMSGM